MRLFFLSFFSFFAFILAISAAQAAENKVVQCGIPDEVHVNTSPGYTYCNIFDRQISYKAKRDLLFNDLEERRKSFAEPRARAYNAYKAKLDAMYDPKNKSKDKDAENSDQKTSSAEDFQE